MLGTLSHPPWKLHPQATTNEAATFLTYLSRLADRLLYRTSTSPVIMGTSVNLTTQARPTDVNRAFRALVPVKTWRVLQMTG